MTKTIDEITAAVMTALEEAGLKVVGSRLIPTGLGARAELDNGAIVNIYVTGTVQVQGRNVDSVRWLLREYVNSAPASDPRLNH